MKSRSTNKKQRIVTFEVVYYDKQTTRTITKHIKGIGFDLSDNETRPLFYITDEFNQDAFCIPYRQLVSCIQLGVEKKPKAARQKPSISQPSTPNLIKMSK